MKANPSKRNMSRQQLFRMLPPLIRLPSPHVLLSLLSSPHPFSPLHPISCLPPSPFSLPQHHQQCLGPAGCKWTGSAVTPIGRIHCDLSIVRVAVGNSEDGSPSKSNIWFINIGAPESRRAEVHVILSEDSGTFDTKEPKTRTVENPHESSQLSLSRCD